MWYVLWAGGPTDCFPHYISYRRDMVEAHAREMWPNDQQISDNTPPKDKEWSIYTFANHDLAMADWLGGK